MQEVDGAVISAAQKSVLREGIAKIQKRVVEGNKAAGADNKRKAVEAALEAASVAVSARRGFLVARLEVGPPFRGPSLYYNSRPDHQQGGGLSWRFQGKYLQV